MKVGEGTRPSWEGLIEPPSTAVSGRWAGWAAGLDDCAGTCLCGPWALEVFPCPYSSWKASSNLSLQTGVRGGGGGRPAPPAASTLLGVDSRVASCMGPGDVTQLFEWVGGPCSPIEGGSQLWGQKRSSGGLGGQRGEIVC